MVGDTEAVVTGTAHPGEQLAATLAPCDVSLTRTSPTCSPLWTRTCLTLGGSAASEVSQTTEEVGAKAGSLILGVIGRFHLHIPTTRALGEQEPLLKGEGLCHTRWENGKK